MSGLFPHAILLRSRIGCDFWQKGNSTSSLLARLWFPVFAQRLTMFSWGLCPFGLLRQHRQINGVSWGLEPLPPPLPSPPKHLCVGWCSCDVCAEHCVFNVAFQPQQDPPVHPLHTEFRVSPHQIWIKFDVSDQAYLSVVAFSGSEFQIIDADLFFEKGKYAATDGSFFFKTTPLTESALWKKRLLQRQQKTSQSTSLMTEVGHKDGLTDAVSLDWEPQNVLLISSDQPIPELERIISRAEDGSIHWMPLSINQTALSSDRCCCFPQIPASLWLRLAQG